MSTVGCHHLCTWTSQLGPFGLGPSGLGPSGFGPSRLGPLGLVPPGLAPLLLPKLSLAVPKARISFYSRLTKSCQKVLPPSLLPPYLEPD